MVSCSPPSASLSKACFLLRSGAWPELEDRKKAAAGSDHLSPGKDEVLIGRQASGSGKHSSRSRVISATHWFAAALAIVVRVAAVFLILFILVIVGVPWRHRGADEAQREKMLSEMPGVMFVSRWMIMVNSSMLPASAAAPGAWRKWLRCAALRRA